MRCLLLGILVITLSVALHAQTTHLDTLKHLDVQPVGSYSAIWGYTAPDGREYAILGVNGGASYQGGTSIIDITDIDSVRQVAFIPGPASSWREMKTYGTYAYVVTEAGGGVQIINLSQLPDTAWLVQSFNYSSGGRSISRSHAISLSDGFLYLNGCATWSPGGIVIFDLRNDPENPVFAGQYQPEYIHDSYILRDTIYASAINSGGGLHIADARNKSSIQEIGKITYTGSGTHNSWLTKNRGYVITTDEIGSTAKTLKIWNIGNLPTIPTSPVATFSPVPGQIEHNITIRGDYAYVAWYSAGVRVVNLEDPAFPLDAGGFDTSPSTSGYNGVWGVYPYFPSGKIIAGDMQNGLWVFSFSGLLPRQPVHLSEPANGDTVSGQDVAFQWTSTADLDRDPHWYEVSVTGAFFDTTFQVNDTSVVLTDVFSRFPSDTYLWLVRARDEWNTTASVDTFTFRYDVSSDVSENDGQPIEYKLFQNYPNPFNPSTQFEFRISNFEFVSFKVYDLLGREVATLVEGELPAGSHRVSFDASGFSGGVYFYKLQSGSFNETRKMLLLK